MQVKVFVCFVLCFASQTTENKMFCQWGVRAEVVDAAVSLQAKTEGRRAGGVAQVGEARREMRAGAAHRGGGAPHFGAGAAGAGGPEGSRRIYDRGREGGRLGCWGTTAVQPPHILCASSSQSMEKSHTETRISSFAPPAPWETWLTQFSSIEK